MDSHYTQREIQEFDFEKGLEEFTRVETWCGSLKALQDICTRLLHQAYKLYGESVAFDTVGLEIINHAEMLKFSLEP